MNELDITPEMKALEMFEDMQKFVEEEKFDGAQEWRLIEMLTLNLIEFCVFCEKDPAKLMAEMMGEFENPPYFNKKPELSLVH